MMDGSSPSRRVSSAGSRALAAFHRRANGGKVDGDAEAAFAQALRRDPGQLGARYFLGEAAMARGDRATVRAMWTPLIAMLAPSDPRRIDLERRLTAMEAGA
jgi:cytochrome c-type biogenesis protein CcmH